MYLFVLIQAKYVVKFSFFLPQEGIRSYFGTPTWQTIGVFLAGVLTTVVVMRKMWRLAGRWRAREESWDDEQRVKQSQKKRTERWGGKRKGFGVEMPRKRQIRALKAASPNRKRDRRRNEWKSSMMQMSRATLVTPELVLFLIYNFKPW